MHNVSANYTLPTVLKTLQPAAVNGVKKALTAKATTTPTAPTTGAAGTGTSATQIGSTFLNLLATELQNQDPTAPMDSTAMVGQMISLNQLDQLISINQTVTGSTGTNPTGLVKPPAATASDSPRSTTNGGAASLLSPSEAGAAVNQLPFDPNTMMPLGSANPRALADTISSSINAASMDSTNTSNSNNNSRR